MQLLTGSQCNQLCIWIKAFFLFLSNILSSKFPKHVSVYIILIIKQKGLCIISALNHFQKHHSKRKESGIIVLISELRYVGGLIYRKRCSDRKNWRKDIWEMEAMEDVLKVSVKCVCVYVCVPSSCIMTCSETTRSPSHLPLRAHNRHAGSLCARRRTQLYSTQP